MASRAFILRTAAALILVSSALGSICSAENILIICNEFLYREFEQTGDNPITDFVAALRAEGKTIIHNNNGGALEGLRGVTDVLLVGILDNQPYWKPDLLRDYIIGRYNEVTDDSLDGCILFGDVAVPLYKSGVMPSSPIDPYDIVYMDMDGTWTDTDGDGCFDFFYPVCQLTKTPEIWLGRLTPSKLVRTAPGDRAHPHGDGSGLGIPAQAELVRNYIERNLSYRSGRLSVPPRALVYDDVPGMPENGNGTDRLYTVCEVVDDENTTTARDFKKRLQEGYQWVHNISHSTADHLLFHTEVTNDFRGGSFRGYESPFLNPDWHDPEVEFWDGVSVLNSLFYFAENCLTCRYTEDNYLGGSYAFYPQSYCLAVVGNAKLVPRGDQTPFYELLFQGATIGEAFIQSNTEFHTDPGLRIYGNAMTILGDPTLTLWMGRKQPDIVVRSCDIRPADNPGVDAITVAVYNKSDSLVCTPFLTAFYDGDPDKGGLMIGRGAARTNSLPPWGADTARVFLPQSGRYYGKHHLYVKVDLNCRVSGEACTQNNKAGPLVTTLGLPLTGDFNGDTKVWTDDFILFAGEFGLDRVNPEFDPAFDLNSDDRIWIGDFAIFVSLFGNCWPQMAEIVETAGNNKNTQVSLNVVEIKGERKSGDEATPLSSRVRQLAVEIYLKSAIQLRGYGVTVNYDPRLLEFLGATPDSQVGEQNLLNMEGGLTPLFLAKSSPKEVGQIWIANSLADSNAVAGSGLLAQLRFNVTGELPGLSSPLGLLKVELFDARLQRNLILVDRPVDVSREFLPEGFSLGQSYPNPANPPTAIDYRLPRETFVSLKIFNALGQQVRTLIAEEMPAGRHRVRWNGRDDSGREVASGIYLYRINAGDFTATRKLLLLK